MGDTQDRLSEVVSVRFTPSEIQRFRALAADRPLSQLVREMCLEAAEAPTTLFPVGASWASPTPQLPVIISVNTEFWTAPTAGDTIRLVTGSAGSTVTS